MGFYKEKKKKIYSEYNYIFYYIASGAKITKDPYKNPLTEY
jgi:hypothetical protein